jgi:hypothetical protein
VAYSYWAADTRARTGLGSARLGAARR